MTDIERYALYRSTCVMCDHPLIDHHPETMRCQRHTTRRRRWWWSRRIQCPCDMTMGPR